MSAILEASTKRAGLSGTELYKFPPIVVGQVIVEWARFSKMLPGEPTKHWGAEMSGKHVTDGVDRWHIGYQAPGGVVFIAVTLEPAAYGAKGPKETVYFHIDDLREHKLEAKARGSL